MAVPKTRVSYSKKKIRKQQWFKEILNSNKKTLTHLKNPYHSNLYAKQSRINVSKKHVIELLFTYKKPVRKLFETNYLIKLFYENKLKKAIEKRKNFNSASQQNGLEKTTKTNDK